MVFTSTYRFIYPVSHFETANGIQEMRKDHEDKK